MSTADTPEPEESNEAGGPNAPTANTATTPEAADTAEPQTTPETPAVPDGEDRRGYQAALALGVLMVAAAVVTLFDAVGLEGGAQAALLGAGAFPTVISALLIAIGGILAVRSLLALRVAPALDAAAGPVLCGRLIRLAALVGALVVFAGVLPYAGFTLSSALLFTAAALLLGAPYPWRMAAYGWTLAGLLFLLFDVLIGLSLPAGPWGF